jgi:hypothetical protein
MLKNILFFLVTTSLLGSCTYEKAEDLNPVVIDTTQTTTCDTTSITFNNTIKPLFIAKCGTDNSSCHKDENSSSGIPLLEYPSVVGQVDVGKLLSSVTRDGNAEEMPQGQPKLDDCSINKIRAWINQGMIE